MKPYSSPDLAPDRISAMGAELQKSLLAVVTALPADASAMQAVRNSAGMNKVFASRLLKALRQDDPLSVIYHVPGPEPLRRFLAGAEQAKVPESKRKQAAAAVDAFERLFREETGGRGGLNALLTVWLPDEHGDFAQGRKQDVYRAWSQIKGAVAETSVVSVLLNPSATAGRIDLMCFMGLLGLRRMRPGAAVKLATRRLTANGEQRAPEAHAGFADGSDPFALHEFCSAPPAPIEPRRIGETMHYLLGGRAFGLRSSVDMLLAEVNRAELEYGRKQGSKPRLNHYFAEVSTPVRTLVFDLIVHEDLFPGQQPDLYLYDTTFEGVADVNDPTRDLDRLDLPETVRALGSGLDALDLAEMPRYPELVGRLCARVGWDPASMRAFRCRVEYPPYGTQVVLAFATPERPGLRKR
ncbi:MAG: hypothetical protein O3A20_05780 [Planctomycetota bacterium]|nr:hypothetical protein [Planctomycetota bacterium]